MRPCYRPSHCEDPFVGPWHRVGCSILQLQKVFAPAMQRSIKGRISWKDNKGMSFSSRTLYIARKRETKILDPASMYSVISSDIHFHEFHRLSWLFRPASALIALYSFWLKGGPGVLFFASWQYESFNCYELHKPTSYQFHIKVDVIEVDIGDFHFEL